MNFSSNPSSNSRQITFSICTPCHNSANTIKSVHQSMENLEYKNFEWILINDASSDETSSIIYEIMESSDIDIKFYDLEENRMVTYCYHLAAEVAEGEFLIYLDHDDSIKPNALNRFLHHWNNISNEDKQDLAGMISLCEDQRGDVVGQEFPESPYISNFFDLIFSDGIRGEKFFCYKTKLMKENNFVLVDRYVPESFVMWKIAKNYNTIFFNESLRVYNLPDLRDTNLSNMSQDEYPKGFRLGYLDLLNNFPNKLYFKPYTLITFIFKYCRFSLKAKISYSQSSKDLSVILFKLIFCLIYPFMKSWYRPAKHSSEID